MEFKNFLKQYDTPGCIILLEGKRNVPDEMQPMLEKLGELLCKKLKHSRFRNGNAQGADYFFSKGISNVNPDRLELILPYTSHRKNFFLSDNLHSLEDINLVNETEVVYQTKLNSKNERLIDLYINGNKGKFGIKGSYLLRDTIKVAGTNSGISKAAFAIFYEDFENPKSGGTGHTMKICEINDVPYIDQRVWMNWI